MVWEKGCRHWEAYKGTAHGNIQNDIERVSLEYPLVTADVSRSNGIVELIINVEIDVVRSPFQRQILKIGYRNGGW